jgi:hypothetical protein
MFLFALVLPTKKPALCLLSHWLRRSPLHPLSSRSYTIIPPNGHSNFYHKRCVDNDAHLFAVILYLDSQPLQRYTLIAWITIRCPLLSMTMLCTLHPYWKKPKVLPHHIMASNLNLLFSRTPLLHNQTKGPCLSNQIIVHYQRPHIWLKLNWTTN